LSVRQESKEHYRRERSVVSQFPVSRRLVQNANARVRGFYSVVDPLMPSVKASRLSKVESRLDARVNRNRAARDILVNHSALHYKYDAPDGRNVFQRIPIERNDVRLQARRDRADLIGHA
jgi:hypothetical protein